MARVVAAAAAAAATIVIFFSSILSFFNHKCFFCNHLTLIPYANQTKEHIFYIQVNVDVV